MSPERAVVGVPAGDTAPATDDVVAAVEAAGAEARVASPADLADTELAAVVAPGEPALRSTMAAEPTAPVLPVGCEPGVQAVPPEALEAALSQLLTAAPTTREHPLLAVLVDGERVGVAVRQAALVSAEPAGISEFALEAPSLGSIDEVRADGLVVATPAGSAGYASAGEGPLCAPGTGLAVVPIAPFRTDRTRWVLPADGCAIQVRRDVTAVAVEVDGEVQRTVGGETTVRVERAGSVETAVVEASPPAFR